MLAIVDGEDNTPGINLHSRSGVIRIFINSKTS